MSHVTLSCQGHCVVFRREQVIGNRLGGKKIRGERKRGKRGAYQLPVLVASTFGAAKRCSSTHRSTCSSVYIYGTSRSNTSI